MVQSKSQQLEARPVCDNVEHCHHLYEDPKRELVGPVPESTEGTVLTPAGDTTPWLHLWKDRTQKTSAPEEDLGGSVLGARLLGASGQGPACVHTFPCEEELSCGGEPRCHEPNCVLQIFEYAN